MFYFRRSHLSVQVIHHWVNILVTRKHCGWFHHSITQAIYIQVIISDTVGAKCEEWSLLSYYYVNTGREVTSLITQLHITITWCGHSRYVVNNIHVTQGSNMVNILYIWYPLLLSRHLVYTFSHFVRVNYAMRAFLTQFTLT